MSTIIAIETSSELASVALCHGDQILVRETSGAQTHSQTVLPMLQSLLAQAGLALAQCDAIAFGSGPGSFTGVRTACGIAQGLAFGLDLPVVPIVTLLAMAQACRESTGASDVLAVLDARMGEVYWAQYRFSSAEGWQTIIEPLLSIPADVSPVGEFVACQPDCVPHAKQIAELARIALQKGLGVASRDAQPLYLRNKVALTTSERLERSAKAQT